METTKRVCFYLGCLAFCLASWYGVYVGVCHVWRML